MVVLGNVAETITEGLHWGIFLEQSGNTFMTELGWWAVVSPREFPLGNPVFCSHGLADTQESV